MISSRKPQPQRLPADADNPLIAVHLPSWQIWRATHALESEQVPYRVDGDVLTTFADADAVLDAALGPNWRQPQRRGIDLLSRQPANRSRASDALGFALSLAVVYGIVTQTAMITDPSARGVAILVAGLVATLLISELVLRDGRRWMFVASMMVLFATIALWFVLKGMGVL